MIYLELFLDLNKLHNKIVPQMRDNNQSNKYTNSDIANVGWFSINGPSSRVLHNQSATCKQLGIKFQGISFTSFKISFSFAILKNQTGYLKHNKPTGGS